MLAYAFRRILQFVPTILVISLIMFFLLNVLPGNAALMAAGVQDRGMDAKYVEQMLKKWDLDKPLHVRYWNYVKNLARGNLGLSFLRGEDVRQVLLARFWPTLKLALVAMAIAIAVGVPLGFLSALRHGSWLDACSMIGAVSGVSLPQFWLGLLLMFLMSVKLQLLPTSGYGDGSFTHLVLPALTLGVGYMALLARTTRAAVMEILSADYVRTARPRGCRGWRSTGNTSSETPSFWSSPPRGYSSAHSSARRSSWRSFSRGPASDRSWWTRSSSATSRWCKGASC